MTLQKNWRASIKDTSMSVAPLQSELASRQTHIGNIIPTHQTPRALNLMEVDPTAAGFCPAKLSKLDHHLISHYIEPKKISGFNLRIVRRGHLAHNASVGVMDIERDKAMRDDTIFRIYSMSKPVTSMR
ncbi:MAG: hypothetical protein CM15mP103_11160 [Gammaproteobacteria bacterium]|nr:MAG: hypothetical protein CM15mP103_11160 [Gammaproteobacteria bacterium]